MHNCTFSQIVTHIGSRLLLCALLLVCVVSGCESHKMPTLEQRMERALRTPEENLLVALNDPDPDERRWAVVKLGESSATDTDEIVTGIGVVARTDRDPYVRAAAVSVLGTVGDERTASWLARSLNDPHPIVRTTAAKAVRKLDWPVIAADDSVRVRMQKALITNLGEDWLDQKIVSAEALDRFRQRQVVEALIDQLDTRDIAVLSAVEGSLYTLTGQRLGDSRQKWLTWLEQVDDPFADALADQQ